MCISGLGWCTSYDWQATALKLSPKTLCVLGRQLLGLLFNYSGRHTYGQATPKLLNACNCKDKAEVQL